MYRLERTVMPVPKEIEIKLELPPTSLPRFKRIPLLQAQKKRSKVATEVSVYFDTDKHKLHKNGVMLRVRRIGNRYVQTIKSIGSAGPFARDEWESEIASRTPDLLLARGSARAAFEQKISPAAQACFRDASTADNLSTLHSPQ